MNSSSVVEGSSNKENRPPKGVNADGKQKARMIEKAVHDTEVVDVGSSGDDVDGDYDGDDGLITDTSEELPLKIMDAECYRKTASHEVSD
jgi:copper oxidase (laccase) domain-containing protein